MAAPQPGQGRVVVALQTDFEPEIGVTVVLAEKVENGLVEAVGTGADGQADHVRYAECLIVEPPQLLRRSEGVGERLEIGHELVGPVFAGHDLLRNNFV